MSTAIMNYSSLDQQNYTFRVKTLQNDENQPPATVLPSSIFLQYILVVKKDVCDYIFAQHSLFTAATAITLHKEEMHIPESFKCIFDTDEESMPFVPLSSVIQFITYLILSTWPKQNHPYKYTNNKYINRDKFLKELCRFRNWLRGGEEKESTIRTLPFHDNDRIVFTENLSTLKELEQVCAIPTTFTSAKFHMILEYNNLWILISDVLTAAFGEDGLNNNEKLCNSIKRALKRAISHGTALPLEYFLTKTNVKDDNDNHNIENYYINIIGIWDIVVQIGSTNLGKLHILLNRHFFRKYGFDLTLKVLARKNEYLKETSNSNNTLLPHCSSDISGSSGKTCHYYYYPLTTPRTSATTIEIEIEGTNKKNTREPPQVVIVPPSPPLSPPTTRESSRQEEEEEVIEGEDEEGIEYEESVARKHRIVLLKRVAVLNRAVALEFEKNLILEEYDRLMSKSEILGKEEQIWKEKYQGIIEEKRRKNKTIRRNHILEKRNSL